jgi:hypothetical protein
MIADKLIHHYPGAQWNMTGETYESLEWFGPGDKPTKSEIDALSAGEIAYRIRAERDSKLVESDWTQVLDAAVDQVAWATYRQALRDIPQQDDFPNTVVWPEQPE